MGFWEILLIIGCAALVISVTVVSVIRKIKGKSSCDCGCDCCNCNACKYAQKNKDQKK